FLEGFSVAFFLGPEAWGASGYDAAHTSHTRKSEQSLFPRVSESDVHPAGRPGVFGKLVGGQAGARLAVPTTGRKGPGHGRDATRTRSLRRDRGDDAAETPARLLHQPRRPARAACQWPPS